MTVASDPAVLERMIAIRRDLHQHPELSWREERTAEKICAVLTELDISFRRGVGGTGVVADLPGPRGTPMVALRADMDALPVTEETGLPFASVYEGVMHACGHDGHTSMLLGAAALLAGEAARPTPVRFIFQPAEETGNGAQAMVEHGVLEGVALIFGGHIDRLYATGTIVVTEGPVNASTDEFVISITGPGGHGARPHESVDPIVVGSLLVSALQTVVSREISPTHPAVLSVGRFHSGSAPNVIPTKAELTGTVRAQEPEVRTQLIEGVRRVAEFIGQTHGAVVSVEIHDGTPTVINSAPMADLAREAAVGVVGSDNVRPLASGNMGGEDFGHYLHHIPGCYVRFGARIDGRESFPAHSSRFMWDENVLGVGAEYYRNVALSAGQKLASR